MSKELLKPRTFHMSCDEDAYISYVASLEHRTKASAIRSILRACIAANLAAFEQWKEDNVGTY